MTYSAMAVPVERVRTLLRLSDGTLVMATAYGDELLSYFVTDDGMVVEQRGDSLILTGMGADEYRQTIGMRRMYVRRRVGSASSALVRPHGRKVLPVILASFADLGFTVADDSASVNAWYDGFCNGERFTGHGGTGSVRDYYADMSGGDFMPEFRVIGPLQLDSVCSYYGKDSGYAKDVNYGAFLRECFVKASLSVEDWSVFDNDGNGTVDMAMIIFAGLGQNYTNSLGITDVIWPKEQPTYISVDGVNVAGCSSCSELRPRSVVNGKLVSTRPDGNGVCLHEMSHALGLPDFYDINNRAFGMDYWSLMDYGSYVNNGLSPVAYTAYERDFMGWQPLKTPDGPCTLRIPCFADGGCGYRIVNDENPDEYYVIENRQARGWDNMLCGRFGGGLMVTHVDYSQGAWTGNRVNADSRHQRMTIIPANNSLIGSNNAISMEHWINSLTGNLYPGDTDNRELTDESVPASEVFVGGYMGKPIYDIDVDTAGVVTLKYCPYGRLDVARNLFGSDIYDTDAMLRWDEVPHAEMYNLRVYDGENALVTSADSITVNYFRLEDLSPQTSYRFRVQAISDAWRNGGWAESDIFRTTADGLPDIGESTRLVRVYNSGGVFVTECYADETSRLALGKGVYIVRYKDGKIKKIHI